MKQKIKEKKFCATGERKKKFTASARKCDARYESGEFFMQFAQNWKSFPFRWLASARKNKLSYFSHQYHKRRGCHSWKNST